MDVECLDGNMEVDLREWKHVRRLSQKADRHVEDVPHLVIDLEDEILKQISETVVLEKENVGPNSD